MSQEHGKNVTEIFSEVMEFLQVCHNAIENTRMGKFHALKYENLLEQHENHRHCGRIVRNSLRPVAVYVRRLHKKQKTLKKMEY